jgi:hypothetical protein
MMHQHIYQLLLDHDCVVVPGLGGFLCQYRPAALDLQKGLVHPPARTIGFNKALQQNDGLLVQEVVIKEALQHKEAEEKVRLFVQETIDKLHQHGSVQLPSIGRLYMDHLKFIQFSPAPEPLPLEDSFGLSAVQVQPVMRRRVVAEPVAGQELEIAEPSPVIKITRQQRSWPYWAAASFAGLLMAGTIWINSLDTDIRAGLQAGFNPLSLVEKVQPQIPVSVEVSSFEEYELADGLSAAEGNPEEVEPVQLPEAPESLYIPGTASAKIFTIVVGAYRGPITASEYKELLISKGYRAEMIGTPGEGLLKVVVHVDAEDELTALRSIRRDVEPEAWLLQ